MVLMNIGVVYVARPDVITDTFIVDFAAQLLNYKVLPDAFQILGARAGARPIIEIPFISVHHLKNKTIK